MLMLRSIALDINLKKTAGKNYSSGFLRSLYLVSLTSGYLWYSFLNVYAANDNSERENTISGILLLLRVELRALLISGPLSRVRKVKSCKVEILICAWNSREKFLIRKANISKPDAVTLLY